MPAATKKLALKNILMITFVRENNNHVRTTRHTLRTYASYIKIQIFGPHKYTIQRVMGKRAASEFFQQLISFSQPIVFTEQVIRLQATETSREIILHRFKRSDFFYTIPLAHLPHSKKKTITTKNKIILYK